MQPPQPAQSNVGNSSDNDKIFQLLTTLTQGIQTQNEERQNQDNRLDHLEKQIGQITEFVGQFRDQGKLPSSTIANPKGGVETAKEIILRSGKEVGTDPQPSKSNHKEDERLQFEEEEYTQPTARVETLLPEAPIAPTPSNSSKVVPNLIISNPVPTNVPIPCRFINSKEEESEKDILEALPKVQNLKKMSNSSSPLRAHSQLSLLKYSIFSPPKKIPDTWSTDEAEGNGRSKHVETATTNTCADSFAVSSKAKVSHIIKV
ncbi:S ribonuclease [Pyrus ussuriensis x Pyrus communis]|uniref:S ribonuclease n=1 Tax=Pyrus ussuriensis x Pyrus communis TaxID=2448454 RepID=A0A5N5GR33_9ROSA|nr:S ribonuclease [Pyrus ussuriensis x Pyrus communis]